MFVVQDQPWNNRIRVVEWCRPSPGCVSRPRGFLATEALAMDYERRLRPDFIADRTALALARIHGHQLMPLWSTCPGTHAPFQASLMYLTNAAAAAETSGAGRALRMPTSCRSWKLLLPHR